MHKFNIDDVHKLESEDRYSLLKPEETLADLGLKEGMLAADIGCGSGFFTIAASEILGYEGKIYAFDLEKQMLTQLRMKIEKSNIVPILSEENKLPLKDKLLDFALLAFVLHEAKDPDTFLSEAKRVIKHEGIIAIIDWIKQSEDEGPPESDRISLDKVVNVLKEIEVDIDRADQLNSSHYVVMGKANH